MLVIQYGAVHLKLLYVSILSCPKCYLHDIIIDIYALQCTVCTKSIHFLGLVLQELFEFGSWWLSELDSICNKNRLMSPHNFLFSKQHKVNRYYWGSETRCCQSRSLIDRPTGRFFGLISDVSSVTFFSGRSKNPSFSTPTLGF